MATLYARQMTLRTCSRFSVIQSDFGADYRTHTHVTGEALYASLTRGVTWQPQLIVVKNDDYQFDRDYKVTDMPVWFTPGIFAYEEYGGYLPDDDMDTTFFNSVSEVYPTTSEAYRIDPKQGGLTKGRRPGHAPTYGKWQAILPDRRFVTWSFSPERSLLEDFAEHQTFFLGKKRAMVQIVRLSPILEGIKKEGTCETSWLQLPTTYGGQFSSFEMATGTVRYIILRGRTREVVNYVEFSSIAESTLCLPDFYLEYIPIGKLL